MPLKPIIFILSLMLLVSSVLAQKPLIKTGYYYAKGGESLFEFLEKDLGLPRKLLTKSGYYQKIKKWNPSLEDTKKLKAGTRVYVEVPYAIPLAPPRSPNISGAIPALAATAAPKIPQRSPAQVALLESEQGEFFAGDEDNESPWNVSMFYALSRGTFTEEANNADLKTISNQDSPLTLGVAVFKPLKNNFNFSASGYVSKLDGAVSNDSGAAVSIPWEYGLTTYLGYKTPEMPFEIYTGFDYERFSSFNTEELLLGEDISTREHTILYGTLGVAKIFEFMNKRWLFKGSYSTSITSAQSRPSLVNPQAFEGNKFIVYLNMKYNKDWFYHGFVKQHSLEGANSLVVNRIGLGFGYIF